VWKNTLLQEIFLIRSESQTTLSWGPVTSPTETRWSARIQLIEWLKEAYSDVSTRLPGLKCPCKIHGNIHSLKNTRMDIYGKNLFSRCDFSYGVKVGKEICARNCGQQISDAGAATWRRRWTKFMKLAQRLYIVCSHYCVHHRNIGSAIWFDRPLPLPSLSIRDAHPSDKLLLVLKSNELIYMSRKDSKGLSHFLTKKNLKRV